MSEDEDIEMCWHPRRQLMRYYLEGMRISTLMLPDWKIQCIDCGSYVTYPHDAPMPMLYPIPKNAREDA